MGELDKKVDKLCDAVFESENSLMVQVATIRQKQEDNDPKDCPTGKSNRVLIFWIWGVLVGGGAGLLGLIISLHI